MPHRTGIWLGALIGLLLTVPLAAILYAGYRLAGFPFVPFNIFDWTTRILPGGILTFGIDAMIRTIHSLNLGQTSTVAKQAEQTLAVAGFVVIGMIFSAVFFIMPFRQRKSALIAGSVAGGLLGLAALLISRGIERTGAGSPAAAFWIVLMFLVWGTVLGWAYDAVMADEHSARLPAGGMHRRRFLFGLGSAAAVLSVAGTALGRMVHRGGETGLSQAEPWSAGNPLPNAGAAVKPAPGTRPELTPVSRHYRIDINASPPAIREEAWRLTIGGLVQRPLILTLDDLRRRAAMHQFITLSCISNTIGGDLTGTTRWTGVSLKHMLPDLGLRPNATHLKIRSADGFYELVALDLVRSDERLMLTYAWDGLPLAPEHGFPLRIYIPDRYGMKQPKWIESIEATDHWEPGYWVTRGWDRDARMKATSVIDTIAVDMMIGQANQQTLIPIGGIAHAGVRGISRVEVRVDGGEWQAAQLRTPPLSGQTWVIWRYDWPFQKGKHTFTVRCFDGRGVLQIAEEAPPHPSGATGLHTRSVML